MASLFLILPGCSYVEAVDPRELKLAPQRWWCEASRGHSDSIFCKSAALKEAIMMADDSASKQDRVDELKSAMARGEAEADGMDATNPARQQMMDGWCRSDDTLRAGPKGAVMCARAKAKSDFLKRREVSVTQGRPSPHAQPRHTECVLFAAS